MNTKYSISTQDRVLVTGAGGFIGAKVVELLLEYGFGNLRCFVRPSSRLDRLEAARGRPLGDNIEVVTGDLLSRNDCRRATEKVSVIFHLAAGIEKSFAGAFMNSALATRNLLDAFLEHGTPERFVNVSSAAVYSNLHLKRKQLIAESCALEDAPQERFDAYCFGKLKQEELVKEYGKKFGLPFVILRPGMVFGPGKAQLSGRVGINTFGFFLHMGGSNRLPMTFVDNCAEAIVLAGLTPGVHGEVFNVVDDESLSSRQFLKAYRRRVKPFFSVPVPYPLAYCLCGVWERYSRWSQGQLPPVFNSRRCAAEWKGNRFSNEKLHQLLGWRPRVGIREGMELFLAQFDEKN